MQPIASSIAPSSRPVGVDTPEPSLESSDSFGALLAGLVALPAIAPESSNDSRQLTLAANSAGEPSDPAESAAAPPKDGSSAPGTTTPLAAPVAAGASAPAPTPAPSAAAADVPAGTAADVPNVPAPPAPSTKPSELSATPPGVKESPNAAATEKSALAASIAKAAANGDATTPPGAVPPAAGRPDGRSVSPKPAAERSTSSNAAARLEQPAAGRHAQLAPALAPAEHPAASATGVTARPILSVFAVATTPGDFRRSDLQASFGELADGSLPRGLATPAAVGGEPAAASLTGGPSGAAVQPVRQLAAVIDRAVTGEIRQLTIQLSPQELGAIDIALSFDEERRLSISILAERPETLELLKGEARQLERLLGRQGIDLADAGLELGLMSQERGSNGNAHESSGQQIPATLHEGAGEDEPLSDETYDALPDGAARAVGADRRLNLSI